MIPVRLIHGDCTIELRQLADAGVRVDACVTDPPYHLASIVSRLGAEDASPIQSGATGVYARSSRGFMGQQWDGGDVAFRVSTWRAVFDVMKPGAGLFAFSATKSYHRMVCAIEDAGFEIHNMLPWIYGTGFPKSHKQHGDWEGWGTDLKPAIEPVVLARRPLLCSSIAENIEMFGTGALNIDACRVPTGDALAAGAGKLWSHYRDGEASANRRYQDNGATNFGPLPGPRGGSAKGRFPANIAHDGSDEVLAAFPSTPGARAAVKAGTRPETRNVFNSSLANRDSTPRGDQGSAARFFYSAKASNKERVFRCTEDGCRAHTLGTPKCGHDREKFETHPTVKPIDLIRWYIRMITPPGGLVLDPFAGTGTTGAAAIAEGMQALLIEQSEDYIADICVRLGFDRAAAERGMVSAYEGKIPSAGPLFEGFDAA